MLFVSFQARAFAFGCRDGGVVVVVICRFGAGV
jgi:hypothetical protein